jgi:hypothetical protein
MAIAYVQEFDVDEDDRSTTNYDTVRAGVNVDADPPEGLIIHTAGFAGGVFRIFDVWESAAHHTRFRDERLTPAVEKMMRESTTGGPPAREYTYDLHDVVRG